MLRPLVTASILFLVFFPSPSRGGTSTYEGALAFRTPYDSKYRKVETYLTTLRGDPAGLGSPSFAVQQSRIQRYLNLAQAFTFQVEDFLDSGVQEDYWQLPLETERLRSGDCEDLAIWLYCQLLDEGFHTIRLTLGLAGNGNKTMHAWVTWFERGKIYVLDPSRREGIYFSSGDGCITYQPRYSYYFDRKWHHQ
jgi:predicted transglutaminase-like cysteine proteinase